MTNDLVSDMLTRIRNASLARHSVTYVRYSKLSLGILKVLENEGYIDSFNVEIVKPEPIVNEVALLQFVNAKLFPILVTLFGIVIDCMAEQS